MSLVNRFCTLTVSCTILLGMMHHADVLAQWSGNPAINNAICTASGDQYGPVICSDGSGGAILAWRDSRPGSTRDTYAQRINSSGSVQWTVDGIALSAGGGNQAPRITEDGSGGAIVSWINGSGPGGSGYIHAQRMNSSGVAQWTTNGIVVCPASGNQASQNICTDGSGGAIIAWASYTSPPPAWDIYVQRINAAGTVQWAASGVPVCTASGSQNWPSICPDGSGGAIITWQDQRGSDWDIYPSLILPAVAGR